ncbi:TRAP transporter substrate-binding protein [Granulosicoccus antarcticus]|uniref:Solute-binding protein n=1 Tax=Granulosicoccus antarcticus IMCC3135 TaxID=1192854 RepID=A0A2Z2NK35_9GAMM|nr:TRAP transporter substrate-binding protein [Granulosicoccus antarcticus]ASJ71539.1 Solute-binding protein [Granulosicoccus antarcticus IMCC3135]
MTSRRKFIRKPLATLAFFMLSAQLSGSVMAAEFTARIGHLESDQQSRHVYLEKVAAIVAQKSDGAVEFQLFPQGQLGGQREMTEGVQLGTLEATVSPAAFLGGFNSTVSILDIPFLLPSDELAAQSLRDGPFGEALLHSFDAKGVKAIALWPNGRKHFTSNKSLDNIAAFGGQKFRVMDSKILIEQFDALGASAIALPFSELYTSLQTGVVDGQENPLDTIQRMKFFEVQKYLVLSGHGAMEDVVLFNPGWWDSIGAQNQAIITDAFHTVVPALTAHKAQAVKAALDDISQSDISVRKISEEERSTLRGLMFDKARAAYIDRAGEDGKALMDVYDSAYDAL